MDNKISEAINILKEGGIVIFPTDTAFGIGCRIDSENSIERLFKIRKRPKQMATPALVSSIEMAQEYLEPIQREVLELMNKYWPGALTIVLPCKINKVSSLVRAGGETLGVRMPNHKETLELIKGVGVPILGPSANFHGGKTPYEFSDLDLELIKLVDFVVAGETLLKEQSTVVDCGVMPWRILRQGAVKISL